MLLSFYAEKPYITDRMAGALSEVFGQPSLVFRVKWRTTTAAAGVVFVNGDLDGGQPTDRGRPAARAADRGVAGGAADRD